MSSMRWPPHEAGLDGRYPRLNVLVA
jgi:hypothetical protein